MTDDLQSWFGNPGEPVAQVDPDDLKSFWRQTSKHQAEHPGQDISFSPKAIAKVGLKANGAIWYRSSMIRILNRVEREQLSHWTKDDEVADSVFRTMATIPMEWIGHEERTGLPFDVEEFFRELRAADLLKD